MPRKSRIDTAGALHHIIVRGIERRRIFRDDVDRDRFLDRLSGLLKESRTICYAWAILPNHVHLLLRTGVVPLATFMRRLLTGYAVSFNKRHRRHGHLFQNRYTSILCEEESYFLELVRYIHVNPIRARIVSGIEGLDHYHYSGHMVLVGHAVKDWQITQDVLAHFSPHLKKARILYRAFVEKGASQGRRKDLTSGGVIRSNKGWHPAKGESVRPKGDERILGSSAFVMETLAAAKETWENAYALRAHGVDFKQLLERVAQIFNLTTEDVLSPGKQRQRVRARSVLCFWAVRELGMTETALSRELRISQPAVSNAVGRGERTVRGEALSVSEWVKNL